MIAPLLAWRHVRTPASSLLPAALSCPVLLDENSHITEVCINADELTLRPENLDHIIEQRCRIVDAPGVLFLTDPPRVFGLQLGDQGRFKPELPYSYKFNLAEQKSPLMDAVTRAGWTWRQIVWQGPAWLRWLME